MLGIIFHLFQREFLVNDDREPDDVGDLLPVASLHAGIAQRLDYRHVGLEIVHLLSEDM